MVILSHFNIYLFAYPLLGISSLLGVSVNSPAIYIVSILIFVALPVSVSIVDVKSYFVKHIKVNVNGKRANIS